MNITNLQTADEYSFLKIGDTIPDFSWNNDTGKEFSSTILFGKYTLIVFFAADCRYCRDNLAYLEKNLFQRNLTNLNILAIGRECNSGQLAIYEKKYAISIKLIADTQKVIYLKFAEKAVPRNYLFDEDGKLLQSIRGFRVDEINQIIRLVS